MSENNVETRVVKMEFDNAKFEHDVRQSMNTIDKFDKKLRFDGVSESVDRITKAFSLMRVTAMTAIANVTNRIVNLGIQMVKSLSVDNIASGWDKFGEKTTAVATMAAQKIKIAGKELTDYSEKMEVINEQLEKLNWFTDETSYNFTDMVNSIGKFTAAGQDLDVSVKAMMGIANWAALSGQNAVKASSAMYQLAQAMGKGYVQLIDWKSIQNLSMDTVEFRETVLETAVAMGELTREADKFITKTGKKFTINQFAEELNAKWFTTDVLVKSLGKYSDAIEKIYEISEETGLTASEVMKRYGDELDEFGLKAFKAAQEARTLADALNSVKDAVSTGWMNTAEKIFGGYDESKELWTDLANELYDVFAEGGNFRNEILGLWRDLGGRADLFNHGDSDQGAFWNIYDSIIAVKESVGNAWEAIFPKSIFNSYNDQVNEIARNFKIFTDRLKSYTETIKNSLKENQKIYNIFKGLFSLIKIGALGINGIRYALDPLWTFAKNVLSDITDRLSYLISHTDKMQGAINVINKVSIKLHDTLSTILEAIDPSEVLGEVLNFLTDIIRTVSNNSPMEDFAFTFTSFFESLKENGTNAENFSRIMKGIVAILDIAFKLTNELVRILSKYLLPVLNVVIDVAAKILSFSSGLLTHIAAFIGDLFVLIDELISSGSLDKSDNVLTDFIDGLAEKAESAKPLLKGLVDIFGALVNAILLIPELLDKASYAITGKSIIENLSEMFNTIRSSIEEFTNNIGNKSGEEAMMPLKMFINGIINFFQGLHSILLGAISLVGKVFEILGNIMKFIGDMIQGVVQGIDKKTVNSLLIAVGILALVLVAIIQIKDLTYAASRLMMPITYNMSNITDAIEKSSRNRGVSAIGKVISSIGFMFIGMATLLNVISKQINLNDFFKGLAFLASVAAVLVAAYFVFKKVKDVMDLKNKNSPFALVEAIKDNVDEAKEKSMNAKSNAALAAKIAAIAKLIRDFGFAFLEVAAAMKIIGTMDDDSFKKGIAALIVFGGIISAITIFTGVFSKAADTDSKSKSKNIKMLATIFVGFAAAFKTISKGLKEVSEIPADKLWNAVGAMSAVMAVSTACLAIMTSLIRSSDKASIINSKLGFVSSSSSSGVSSGQGDALLKLILGMSAMIVSISGSIALLSLLDPGKMWSAVAALAVIIGGITASIILIEKFALATTKGGYNSRIGTKQADGIVMTILSMSAMIVSISGSIALLASLDPGKMWGGLAAMSLIIGQITAMLIVISKCTKGISISKVGTNMLMLGGVVTSIMILVAGLSMLGNLPLSGIIAGTLSMSLMFANLIASLIIMNKIGSKVSISEIGKNMLMLGGVVTSIMVLVAGLSILGTLPLEGIIAGTLSMSLMFANLMASLIIMNKIGSKLSISEIGKNILLLGGLSSAMLTFAGSMRMLANVPWQTITAAASGMALVLSVFAGIVVIISKMDVKETALLSLSVSLIAMSSAILILAFAFKQMENINMEKVKDSLLPLLLVLLVFAGGSLLLAKYSGAVLVLGVALASFAIGALAFSIAVEKVVAVMPQFLEMLSSIFEFINNNSDTILEALTNIGDILISVFFTSAQKIINSLSNLLPDVFNFIHILLDGVSKILIEDSPKLIETVISFIDSLITSISEHSESIIIGIGTILQNILTWLADNIVEISNKLLDILLKIIEVLTDRIDEIVAALVDLLIALTDALAKELYRLTEKILPILFNFVMDVLGQLLKYAIPLAGAVTKLVLIITAFALRLVLESSAFLTKELIAFLGGIILLLVKVVEGMTNVLYESLKYIFVIVVNVLSNVFTDLFPMLMAAGRLLGVALAKGVINALYDALKNIPFINDLLSAASDTINQLEEEAKNSLNKYGSSDDVIKAIKDAGKEMGDITSQVTSLMNDITEEGMDGINSAVNDSLSQLSDTMSDFGEQIGYNLSEGLDKGIKDNKDTAEEAGEEIGEAAEKGAKDKLGIHSPSTEFMDIGRYMCLGLSIGISENQNTAINSAVEMMNNIIKSTKYAIDSALSGNLLTITPVIDLSNVRAGANDIAQLMTNAGGSGISVSGRLASIASSELNRSKDINTQTIVNNAGDTYNNTFNVTTDNPQQFSEDVDKELQRQRILSKLAKGGAF